MTSISLNDDPLNVPQPPSSGKLQATKSSTLHDENSAHLPNSFVEPQKQIHVSTPTSSADSLNMNAPEISSEEHGKRNAEKLNTKQAIGERDVYRQRKKPKTGVLFLSRLPPNIEITSVRSLLSRTGQINNMWLRPETRDQQKQRLSLGGSRRRTTFRDGWVEYLLRRDAKKTVALLNGQPIIGAKRKGRWANDLWCMKFLPDFEWRHLTAEVFGGRERTLKVREEMASARRQRNWIEERSRLADHLKKKGDRGEGKPPVRRFLQKRPLTDSSFGEDVDETRAREAAVRVDEELESGKPTASLNENLLNLLVKRRKT